MEKVLNDSIERFSYFAEKFEDEGWNEETSNFVVHAFFLLGELQAGESLDCIFNVLSQSEEYYDIYLGDFLTTALWEPIYKIANNRLKECLQFMFQPGIHTYAKTLFPDIAQQVVHHQPQRKDEIIEWYRQVIKYYLSCKPEDNIIDSDVIGLLICDILDINARELLPEIKQLFDKEIVSIGICGIYTDVKMAFGEYIRDHHQKEIQSISERYRQITETWAGYNEEENNYPYEDFYEEPQVPVVKEQKIGRNEPCPCGSGKSVYYKISDNKTQKEIPNPCWKFRIYYSSRKIFSDWIRPTYY